MIVENALGRWKCPFSAYPAVHIEKKGIGMTIERELYKITPYNASQILHCMARFTR